MTDDLLERAARALRDAHTGQHPGSGFTRARIMSSLHQGRRRRVLRWAILSPLVSLLLVGSAWAQSTGKWPALWRAVASVFVSSTPPAAPPASSPVLPAAPRELREPPLEAPEPTAPETPRPETPRPETPRPETPRPVTPELEPTEPDLSSPEPSSPSGPSDAERQQRSEGRAQREAKPPPRASSTRERLSPSSARRAAPARAPTAAPPSAEAERAAQPPPDPELLLFRAAHDLHFAGRARQAIDAYAEYLSRYPRGRFVPEALYNGALDHIKLGNTAAAREALEPFAAGKYGGYRQQEAQRLLDALP